MGVTYKAFDINLRCPVKLKVISERYLGDESARLRFLREARAAARQLARHWVARNGSVRGFNEYLRLERNLPNRRKARWSLDAYGEF
jgi:hypothetical protein